jgi:hypothetical protein
MARQGYQEVNAPRLCLQKYFRRRRRSGATGAAPELWGVATGS